MTESKKNSGMTLLELLLAMSIVAILGGVSARVLAIAIESWDYSRHRDESVHGACWALDHILNRARLSNRLLLPLHADPNHPGNVLAFSAMVDTDGDGLVDEDPRADITGDGRPGVRGIDDDGDGDIDEGGWDYRADDDEDGAINEDPVNGLDDDGDGLIDEDPGGDINGDGEPGIAGKDDDGDGDIDEWDLGNDDDEDAFWSFWWRKVNEDSIEYWVYYLDPDGYLMERYYMDQAEVLLEGVTTFQVIRTESDDNTSSGVYLTLGVTASGEEEIRLKTLVYLRGIQ